MVSTVRRHIYDLLHSAVRDQDKNKRHAQIVFKAILGIDFEGGKFVLKIPEKSFNQFFDKDIYNNVVSFEQTDIINKIEKKQYSNDNFFTFTVDKYKFISDVLTAVPESLSSCTTGIDETIIVEFSSPNIAKPFHMGHLRSTVVGQFVANILANSFNVIKVNYLGDWGTQFGLIQAGLESMFLDMSNLTDHPLKVINEAYIRANKDEKLINQAKIITSTLEKRGDSKEFDTWKKLKELTINHLKETYGVLGVEFDEYAWESQYAKGFNQVLEKMKDLGLIREIDNQLVVVKGEKIVPLMKSDGTSLYLSRDILAALDRYRRYKCKSIKYVIDKSQEDHVSSLQFIVSSLTGVDLVDHVKFGKILGMSTRKGTSVFLSDILDKATELMAFQQKQSPNTRNFSFDITQTLAVTTLVVYLLKQRRSKNLTFDWDLALQSKGDSGVKLQYTHCRLFSLEEKCGVELPSECQPLLITEHDALSLIAHLDRFEQVKALSEITLESSYLVNYAFKLCNLTSLCLTKLPIKGEKTDIARQRLLLFHKTRTILKSTMLILGLKPLNMM